MVHIQTYINAPIFTCRNKPEATSGPSGSSISMYICALIHRWTHTCIHTCTNLHMQDNPAVAVAAVEARHHLHTYIHAPICTRRNKPEATLCPSSGNVSCRIRQRFCGWRNKISVSVSVSVITAVEAGHHLPTQAHIPTHTGIHTCTYLHMQEHIGPYQW
jgi:hypothetical protein